MNEGFKSIMHTLHKWGGNIFDSLPSIAVSILIMFLFIFLARYGKRIFVRVMNKFSGSKAVNQLLGNFLSLSIIILGLMTALDILNLNKTVTSLLAGAGIIGLAIGFSFQDMIANIIAGVLIAIRKPFVIGDVIETNSYVGEVKEIKLSSTVIDNGSGQLIFLPSRDIAQKSVINYTVKGQSRITLNLTMQYDYDIDNFRSVVLGAVSRLPFLMDAKPVEFFCREFGDAGIKTIVRFWFVPGPDLDSFKATNTAIELIYSELKLHNIKLPLNTVAAPTGK